MTHWVFVESDFQRDYGIELARVWHTLSWRRFITLLSGLSKDSSFLTVVLHKKENAPEDDNPEDVATFFMTAGKK